MFLYTSNKEPENSTKKSILFTIASKIIKWQNKCTVYLLKAANYCWEKWNTVQVNGNVYNIYGLEHSVLSWQKICPKLIYRYSMITTASPPSF